METTAKRKKCSSSSSLVESPEVVLLTLKKRTQNKTAQTMVDLEKEAKKFNGLSDQIPFFHGDVSLLRKVLDGAEKSKVWDWNSERSISAIDIFKNFEKKEVGETEVGRTEEGKKKSIPHQKRQTLDFVKKSYEKSPFLKEILQLTERGWCVVSGLSTQEQTQDISKQFWAALGKVEIPDIEDFYSRLNTSDDVAVDGVGGGGGEQIPAFAKKEAKKDKKTKISRLDLQSQALWAALWPLGEGAPGLHHTPWLWQARFLVYPFWKELFQDENLLSSFDGGKLHPAGLLPENLFKELNQKTDGSKPALYAKYKKRIEYMKKLYADPKTYEGTHSMDWFHCDRGPETQATENAFQGMFLLTDSGVDDGGLLVFDQSHLIYKQYLEDHPEQKFSNGIKIDPHQLQQEWDVNMVKICGKAGDFVVWDSRLFHMGLSGKLLQDSGLSQGRMCLYVSMHPRVFATSTALSLRVRAYEKQLGSGHDCVSSKWSSHDSFELKHCLFGALKTTKEKKLKPKPKPKSMKNETNTEEIVFKKRKALEDFFEKQNKLHLLKNLIGF